MNWIRKMKLKFRLWVLGLISIGCIAGAVSCSMPDPETQAEATEAAAESVRAAQAVLEAKAIAEEAIAAGKLIKDQIAAIYSEIKAGTISAPAAIPRLADLQDSFNLAIERSGAAAMKLLDAESHAESAAGHLAEVNSKLKAKKAPWYTYVITGIIAIASTAGVMYPQYAGAVNALKDVMNAVELADTTKQVKEIMGVVNTPVVNKIAESWPHTKKEAKPASTGIVPATDGSVTKDTG